MSFKKWLRRYVRLVFKFLFHLAGSILVKPFVIRKRPVHVITGSSLKILYVCLAYRGDLILNFPAISAVKRRFPHSHLACWIRKYNRSTARLSADIDEVIVYDNFRHEGERALLEFLHRRRHSDFLKKIGDFDIYIDDSGYGFSALAGTLARIPFRIGRNSQGYGFLYHYEIPYDYDAHLVKKRFKLLEPLGVNLESAQTDPPVLNLPSNMKADMLNRFRLDSVTYFTVQPFGGWQAKNWDAERFAYVIGNFSRLSSLLPVFIGGEADRKPVETIIEMLNCEALNTAGRLDVCQTAALIASARLHFGIDSVGAHLATGVGTKSLTIFGPTNPRLIAFLSPRNIAVLKKTSCTPAPGKIYCCHDAGRTCKNLSCMTELKAEDVLAVLESLWNDEHIPPVVEL